MPQTLTKRQLLEDFELVAEHYDLRKTGEYDIARQIARDDIESAKVCYRAMAEKTRGEA